MKLNRFVWVLAILIIGSGAVLRFAHLDADIPELQNADDIGDEGYWADPARDLVRYGVMDLGSNFRQAIAGSPLSVLTLTAAGRLAGGLDFVSGRAVSALYGVLILLLGAFYFFRIRREPLGGLLFLALYGLFPLTVFYGRMIQLEQHLLFWLFLTFVLIEMAKSPRGWIVAGFVFSVAFLVKTVAVFVLPVALLVFVIRYRKECVKPLFYFGLGMLPLMTAFSVWFLTHFEDFTPTFNGLKVYHKSSGPFINLKTIKYFWTTPLVQPYLLFILAALALWASRKEREGHWSFLWFGFILIALSLFKYESIARHWLLFFPLLLFVSTTLSKYRLVGLTALVSALLLGSVTTLGIGRRPFFDPRYTERDAARKLGEITDETDVVIGAHGHALSLYGRFQPRMRLNLPRWKDVDPITKISPTVLLSPVVYNGVPGAGQIFPQVENFKYVEELSDLRYLDRFHLKVHRIFPSEQALARYRRIRGARPSRFDGLIYNRLGGDMEAACLVKGLLVAESRGDLKTANPFERLPAGISEGSLRETGVSRDTRRSLLAASGYIHHLRERFSSSADAVPFSYAAYNGGVDLVDSWVKGAPKKKTRWERDVKPRLLKEKTSEVPYYVDAAMGVYRACVAP